MKNIKDYQIIEQMAETRGSIIYRAMKEGQDDTVVIKSLKASFPSPSDIARFQQEYYLIREIDIDGVIKTFEIIIHEGNIALVTEDFDGTSIKKLLNDGKKFSVESFLKIAVKIAQNLGHLHSGGIIHLDIKPSNILINVSNGTVKISDFGISKALTREDEEIYDPQVISGTLAYMSPEQTGRMNRTIDSRSDLYSLGVAFYEMLTRSIPFKGADPMSIIHSHIAVEPESPSSRNSEIPEIISEIILKLMAKNAEDRYQNAFGLAHDLKECQRLLKDSGTIGNFKLASKDISSRMSIPQKLYGRENEIEKLVSSFDSLLNEEHDVVDNNKKGIKVMLVSGEPGIGKSALINEIHKPIVARRGYFISGKYQQFRKDSPYSGIIQAFQGLTRQILSESKDRIEKWKVKILEALGSNGKIITDMVPEIEHIIGPQPEPTVLGPEESKNRFNYVMEKFASVFMKKDHPVVLFLDDLQWVDMASLQLFKTIFSSQEVELLYIIGSFRSNEVDNTHPLYDTLREIKKNGIPTDSISLGPIENDDVNNLVSDFLKCDKEKSQSLADLIFNKTGGNPIFYNPVF